MTEPVDVDEALDNVVKFCGSDYFQMGGIERKEMDAAIASLRARLRREREAIETIRNEVAMIGGAVNRALAALDAILRGEGTT